MDIISTTLNNFLSHESTKLDLYNRGLLLLDGSNGSGKSSCLEGITWSIFGQTSRGARTDQVIRRNSTGGCHVCTTIKLSNNDTLECHRYRQHKRYRNKFIVICNGKEVTRATDPLTAEMVTEYLQVDYPTFTSIVLFAQDAVGFASLNDAAQKEIFEKILNLEHFASAYNRTNALVKDCNSSVVNATYELNSVRNAIAESEKRLLQYDEMERQFYDEIEATVVTLYNKLELLKDEEPDAHQITAEISKLEEVLTDDITDINDLHQQCQQQINALSIEQAKYSTKLAMMREKRSTLLLTDADAQIEQSTDCPTCGQPMPNSAQSHLRQAIEAQNKQVREDIRKLRDDSDDAENQLRLVQKRIDSLRTSSLETQVLIDENNALKQQLEELYAVHSQFEINHQMWRNEISRLEGEIALVQDRQSPYNALREQEHIKLASFQAELIEKTADLDELKDEVRYIEFCEKMFSNKGIKSHILDAVTPFLNQRANEYLSELTDYTAKVKFNTQTTLASGEKREKFNIEVAYATGGDTYVGVSGGERRKLDIANILALGDLAASRSLVPIRLRLLDEVCDGLDGDGIRKVVTLLKNRIVKEAGTVLCMSHSGEMKEHFDKVITVRKINGVSRLEEN